MFSFHKPKIYRSMQGCCICRAKSSSSRFTDSTRYEEDFEKCFNIDEHRQGEICNACVLLVKRWKKLPKGSLRNWEHVVDARAGPGTKSMNKIKSKAAAVISKDPLKEERFKKKHRHKVRSSTKKTQQHHIVKHMQASALTMIKPPCSPSQFSDDIGDDCMSEDTQSYDADYLSNSDLSDNEYDDTRSSDRSSAASKSVGRRRKSPPTPLHYSSFLDLNYWKKTEICCGIIFKGANGECLLDASLWRPCGSCKVARHQANQNMSQTTTTTNIHDSATCSKDTVQSSRVTTRATSLSSQSQPSAPPMSGGYADTDPPAPVEVEPMSYGLNDAYSSPVFAHIPHMDSSQTEMAVDVNCSATHLDNLTTTTSIDNLTLPSMESGNPLPANMSPIVQQSAMCMQLAV